MAASERVSLTGRALEAAEKAVELLERARASEEPAVLLHQADAQLQLCRARLAADMALAAVVNEREEQPH